MAQYHKAKRENETVYLQRVPDASTLPAVQAAPMVKSLAPEGVDPSKAEEMFQGIVPDSRYVIGGRHAVVIGGRLSILMYCLLTALTTGDDWLSTSCHDHMPHSAKAMSKYTDMVDGIVRCCSDKMAAASDDARLRLREWDLPESLDALSTTAASGLPDGLRSELEAADSAGGLTHLMDMAAQIRVRGVMGVTDV